MKKPDCVFCSSTPNGIKPIFESNHFYVTPSLGQIVPGYLLINTKEHYLSLSQMPYEEWSKEYFDELEEIKRTLRILLSKNYAPPIFFEHGAVKERQGVCCVDHAHLHCVPLGKDIIKEMNKFFSSNHGSEGGLVSNLPTIKRLNLPYIYYNSIEGEESVTYLSPPYPPSQFMRQLVAIAAGKPDQWDWRTNPTRKEIVEVAENLRSKVFTKREISFTLAKQDFSKLEEQIQGLPGLIYKRTGYENEYWPGALLIYSINNQYLLAELTYVHRSEGVGAIHVNLKFMNNPDLEKLVTNYFNLQEMPLKPKSGFSFSKTCKIEDKKTICPIKLEDWEFNRFILHD